ncbi:thiamine phosphate synthase [Marinimicrobium agarilyticum]|uniref:thiamine phosphate synthase n=1 Tax=Marinimicrobium agarilyticum TaxID=306546 RepID=UPI0004156C7C|nr:thiamine phosphate synthase [Marinimicrobium agarilyticum]
MPKRPLYAIVTTRSLREALPTAVESALRGGAGWIQYRDKSSQPERRQRDASTLKTLCHQYGAKLIINDDVDLALATGADGVHLGQGDGSPREARRRLGPEAILGVTCHASMSLARQALEDGASYLAFGRFFPSRTKPQAPPAPLELLSEARSAFGDTPLVAIGGITLDNGGKALHAGADWLAVGENLFGADDIESQARAYRQLTL